MHRIGRITQHFIAGALLSGLLAGGGTLPVAAATPTPTPSPAPSPATLNRIAPQVNVAVLMATPTPTPIPPPPKPVETKPADTSLSRPVEVDKLPAGFTVIPTTTPPPDQQLPAPGASDLVLPPPPSDTQIQRGGPSDASRDATLATPDYLQPGDHEMDFTPTVVQQRTRDTIHPNGRIPACYTGNNPADPGSTLVGWAQGLGTQQCETLVSETAVRFDISPLLQGGPKIVTSAQLTMNEAPWEWTDGDGNPRTVAGCVAAVGVANTDFVADPPTGNDLYSNDTYVDVTPSGATQFDMRVPVEDWFSPDSPRYGFVLKGSIEDLQNDDSSSCMSQISNVQLIVDYTVL